VMYRRAVEAGGNPNWTGSPPMLMTIGLMPSRLGRECRIGAADRGDHGHLTMNQIGRMAGSRS